MTPPRLPAGATGLLGLMILMWLTACSTAARSPERSRDPVLASVEHTVRQFCSRKPADRVALAEDLRRTLSPAAQVIILCDP